MQLIYTCNQRANLEVVFTNPSLKKDLKFVVFYRFVFTLFFAKQT
ncbi:hypothetical protein C8P70_10285 [Myroides indicus]|uniref:Uncharacterized protein n=1 Tax=Myroides indicus TaxID=1323422 RepID=A0A4V3E9A1_9FLAO|nr:hypothetical protein C8P70_10285 [Myroides indicus]